MDKKQGSRIFRTMFLIKVSHLVRRWISYSNIDPHSLIRPSPRMYGVVKRQTVYLNRILFYAGNANIPSPSISKYRRQIRKISSIFEYSWLLMNISCSSTRVEVLHLRPNHHQNQKVFNPFGYLLPMTNRS